MSGQLILVTGASGHLGFRVLVEALEAGYRVRAPVRRPEQIATIKAAPSIQSHLDNLEIVIVPDILAEGAYDEALVGVTGVIHCASPLAKQTSGSDYEREMIQPAIQGTVGILRSALKVPTIKRFVITSSLVAIISWEDIALVQSNKVFTDKDTIPTPSGPYTNLFEAYSASKVFARHATDDFVATKNPQFDIINIMPSFIVGKNELATFENVEHGTNAFALAPLRGYKNPPAVGVSVYLNDVAQIHVKALDSNILPEQAKPFYDHFFASSGGLEGTNFDDSIEIYKKNFAGQVDEKHFPLNGTQPSKLLKLDSKRTEEVFGLKFASYETQVKSVVEHYAELARASGA